MSTTDSGWDRSVSISTSCLLAVCFVLAWSSVSRKSVVIDEFAYVPNGLALLRARAFQIDRGVPPLAKMVSSIPLLLTSARIDPALCSRWNSGWEAGKYFATVHRDRYPLYILLSRLPPTFFLVLTVGLSGWLASRLHGQAAALVALFMACMCPTLLAHGGLATTDIYLAATFMGFLVAFDVLIERPTWLACCALGVLAGLACLFKFTGLFLFLLLPAIPWFAPWLRTRAGLPRVRLPKGICTLVLLTTALLVVNAGYLCGGTIAPIGDYRFFSELMQQAQSILPRWAPIPLPYYFVTGLDTQLTQTGTSAYLLEEFRSSGFWDYYLVALLVKTPLSALALASIAMLVRPKPMVRELPMLLLAMIFVVILSCVGHKNIGVRYVLFVYPILAVWIARLAGRQVVSTPVRRRLATAALVLGFIGAGVETGSAWPDFIPYFNAAAGGSARGHHYLLDSNLDWGQDLPALKEYMARHGIEEIDLAYFGRIDPGVYGVRYHHLFQGRKNRYAAVSANLLWGRMYFINGTNVWPDDRDCFASLRELRPAAILGYSIYVYDMGR